MWSNVNEVHVLLIRTQRRKKILPKVDYVTAVYKQLNNEHGNYEKHHRTILHSGRAGYQNLEWSNVIECWKECKKAEVSPHKLIRVDFDSAENFLTL